MFRRKPHEEIVHFVRKGSASALTEESLIPLIIDPALIFEFREHVDTVGTRGPKHVECCLGGLCGFGRRHK